MYSTFMLSQQLHQQIHPASYVHLDVLIDWSCDTTVVLIHCSELSQAEPECHRVADLDINAYQLPCHSCVVLLSHHTGLATAV